MSLIYSHTKQGGCFPNFNFFLKDSICHGNNYDNVWKGVSANSRLASHLFRPTSHTLLLLLTSQFLWSHITYLPSLLLVLSPKYFHLIRIFRVLYVLIICAPGIAVQCKIRRLFVSILRQTLNSSTFLDIHPISFNIFSSKKYSGKLGKNCPF